jgi:hypothetical protein
MSIKIPSLRRSRKRLLLSMFLALLLTGLIAGVALAHETRVIGKYKLVVGFLNEPALLNEPNSIDFRVSISDTGKGVEGLDKTIKAEVVYGGSSMPLALSARFGQPGAYNAYFIPTRAGTYIFHFTGAIEGQNIDEKFESGPGRFNDVSDTSALQFPVKVPAPSEAAAQIKTAQDAASGAQTAAYLGIAAGVLGVILGGLSLLRRK